VVEWTSGRFALSLHDNPTFTSVSEDNARKYDREYNFVGEGRPVSKYGMACREPDGANYSCMLLAGGGASRVNEHSAVVVNSSCYVGVGDTICSLSLPTLDLKWSTKVDAATCFGVYFSHQHNCLVSHGEIEVARVSLSGEIVWSASGKDIFSGGLRVLGEVVEVIDFNHEAYRIDIATGRTELIRSSPR
jgi:hypothetical protein